MVEETGKNTKLKKKMKKKKEGEETSHREKEKQNILIRNKSNGKIKQNKTKRNAIQYTKI